MVRGNEELAFFGEAAFDLTDNLTAAFSFRRFDSEVSLIGFYGTVFWPQRFGGRGPDEENATLVTKDKDTVIKGNVSWHVTDDIMLYGTYSEGYRPGGLNRDPSTVAGFGYDPDFVESWEVGVKATGAGGRMRYNMAAFTMDWNDFQLSRLDNSISPATLTYNIGNARSRGFEGDVAYLLTEDWDVSVAFSVIDAELAEDYWINSANAGDGNPNAEKGRAAQGAEVQGQHLHPLQLPGTGLQRLCAGLLGAHRRVMEFPGWQQPGGARPQAAALLRHPECGGGHRARQLGRGTVRSQPRRRAGGGVQERLLLGQPHHHQPAENHRPALAAEVLSKLRLRPDREAGSRAGIRPV